MSEDSNDRDLSAEPLQCENGTEPEPPAAESPTIEQLPISVRAYKALESAGIKTVDELRQWSEPQLLKIRNLGRRSLNEIKEVLSDRDVELRHLSPAELNEELTSSLKKPLKVRCAYQDRAFHCARTAMRGGDLCWSHERMRQGMTGSTPWGYGGQEAVHIEGRWRNKVLETLKHDAEIIQTRLDENQERVKNCKASLAEIDRLIKIIKTLPDNTMKPKRGSAK